MFLTNLKVYIDPTVIRWYSSSGNHSLDNAIKGMEYVPNMFMSFDNKYLFLDVTNILIQIGLFKQSEIQTISEAYLRTETFGHIGFEAKQEMKPYCTQNLSGSHFEKVFFKMESPM